MPKLFNFSDAKLRGDRYFWPDVPCIEGHHVPRFVANGRCAECWFQAMHGRSHTGADLAKGIADADFKRDRQAFVRSRQDRAGVGGPPNAGCGSLDAARKAAIKRLWQNARNRASVRGIKFSVRATEIELHRDCPVLGIPLIYRATSARSNSDACAVLERVSLERGYEVSNVTVMSARASRLRGDATNIELALMSGFFAFSLQPTD